LDDDEVLLLASRTEELAPKTAMELALYRKVQTLSVAEQKQLLRKLEQPES
jgi:hypothetical protein